MNQVALQQYDFSIIPSVASHFFEKTVMEWYEFTVMDKNIFPLISTDLFYDCHIAQVSFLDYLYDIDVYQYTKMKTPEYFHPMNFPVDVPDSFFEQHEEGLATFRDVYHDEHETLLHKDIKKVMDKHHMSYTLDHALWPNNNEITYHNLPIKGVW